ncbi:hypothetical protein CC1G_04935 [Coprinopsis cinerea okayama7|uniref:PHD-type domain-containing protein n=1 Tax=Coprinopsis cinerea (strain Okayama-7 / 130 / ATCC MYA-4618 / FGSC 9003) TaxID=240176 RepID=A8PFL6_COPC7|nr:hypothetical protein CC1G_04935 [Coprinopsis cinerea okayama7\|eukprot:XP_001841091.2 hypothetical protein CC1G_04935 [Coprinopsis cinerea okayama7\
MFNGQELRYTPGPEPQAPINPDSQPPHPVSDPLTGELIEHIPQPGALPPVEDIPSLEQVKGYPEILVINSRIYVLPEGLDIQAENLRENQLLRRVDKFLISSLRQDPDGRVWFLGTWFYTAKEAKQYFRDKRTRDILDRLGVRSELILSDHWDVVHPDTVIDAAPYDTFVWDDKESTTFPLEGWFVRYHLTIPTTGNPAKLRAIAGPITNPTFLPFIRTTCICKKIFAPDDDNQIHCPSCKTWYHFQCTKLANPQPQPPGTQPHAPDPEPQSPREISGSSISITPPPTTSTTTPRWNPSDSLFKNLSRAPTVRGNFNGPDKEASVPMVFGNGYQLARVREQAPSGHHPKREDDAYWEGVVKNQTVLMTMRARQFKYYVCPKCQIAI